MGKTFAILKKGLQLREKVAQLMGFSFKNENQKNSNKNEYSKKLSSTMAY